MRRLELLLVLLLALPVAASQLTVPPTTDASKLTSGTLPAGRLPKPTTNATTCCGPASVYLSSAYTNATTNFTSTNLAINLSGGTAYRVQFHGTGSNNTTADGGQFTLMLSDATGCTLYFVWKIQSATQNAYQSTVQTSSGASTIGGWTNAVGGTEQWVDEDGIITGCTNATTVTVQGKATTGGTLTLDPGSFLRVEQVGGGV